MTGLLWAILVIAVGSVVAIFAIAIIGTIDDSRRRQSVTWAISWIAFYTVIVCVFLLVFNHRIQNPDVAAPVQIEPISGLDTRGKNS